MANPQPTDAHIRIAHSITEAIMTRDFSKRQRKILDLILRLSWGCGKKTATIPHQKDFQYVGVQEGHIKKELEWLIDSKIITREGNSYSFVKDFELWQISRNKPYQPEKVTELVSMNLKELTKTVSENLLKGEDSTYQKMKFLTSDLASVKESIKESVKVWATGSPVLVTCQVTIDNTGNQPINMFTVTATALPAWLHASITGTPIAAGQSGQEMVTLSGTAPAAAEADDLASMNVECTLTPGS